jgi:predicted membrane channel-forming protein YqfA (hemolysin III family)
LKNNYWFKRRRYGYGWAPITWQGKLLVIALILIIASGTYLVEFANKNTQSDKAIFVLILFLASLIVVAISLKKGPKPRWQWGIYEKDQKDD